MLDLRDEAERDDEADRAACRKEFNQEKPHGSLGHRTPAEFAQLALLASVPPDEFIRRCSWQMSHVHCGAAGIGPSIRSSVSGASRREFAGNAEGTRLPRS